MTVYAYFDHTADSPSPVLGWFDTVAQHYPNLPDEADLLELTEGEKSARFDGGGWAVADGRHLVQYFPVPVLTLAQQADQALAERLAAGIVITSTSNPDLDATYALDPTSTAQIFQIGLYASQFGVFPSGGGVVMYPEIRSLPRLFTIQQFIAFLRAVAPLVSALETQAAIMRAGGQPSWPDQSATIL
jgi:hypothetical protein